MLTAIEVDLAVDIFDISGKARLPVKGTFDQRRLSALLIETWIPHFECHQCGRFDYCKFAERRVHAPTLGVDIQCGVAVSALQGLIERCFEVLVRGSTQERQHFVDGAFHFFKFVYGAELQIGNFLDKDMMDWWDTHAPAAFGQLTSLRRHLDAVAHHMGRFQPLRARNAVLLVEGWSEKKFFDTLALSGLAWFQRLLVRTYDGKDNARPGRIELLLRKYKEEGYVVYMQGDRDGRVGDDRFADLKRKDLLQTSNVFLFAHDFETAIPISILHEALSRLELLTDVSREDFLSTLSSNAGAVRSKLRDEYQLDLKDAKVPLAEAVAEILNAETWWSDDEFMATELGRFLHFVQLVE